MRFAYETLISFPLFSFLFKLLYFLTFVHPYFSIHDPQLLVGSMRRLHIFGTTPRVKEREFTKYIFPHTRI